VNQEESEQNEVDGMKKGADSTGKVVHIDALSQFQACPASTNVCKQLICCRKP